MTDYNAEVDKAIVAIQSATSALLANPDRPDLELGKYVEEIRTNAKLRFMQTPLF
jgi:hypothetical protein